jgi:micrococcal nuclease
MGIELVEQFENSLYVYPAKLNPDSRWKQGVYDGDTIEVVLDLGDKDYAVKQVRVAGIDTPEMIGNEKDRGIVARSETVHWLLKAGNRDWPLFVQTIKNKHYDSFGRYLAHVWRRCDGANLTDYLLARGYPPYMK